jgi:hypothetical protein
MRVEGVKGGMRHDALDTRRIASAQSKLFGHFLRSMDINVRICLNTYYHLFLYEK